MANITVKMPLEIWFQRSVNVSWVEMEKSLSLFVATPRRNPQKLFDLVDGAGMSSWVKRLCDSIKSCCRMHFPEAADRPLGHVVVGI